MVDSLVVKPLVDLVDLVVAVQELLILVEQEIPLQ